MLPIEIGKCRVLAARDTDEVVAGESVPCAGVAMMSFAGKQAYLACGQTDHRVRSFPFELGFLLEVIAGLR
jgi:hypothetical protein